MVDSSKKGTLTPSETEIPINIEEMTQIIKNRNPERGKLLEQMLVPQVSKPEMTEEMMEILNAKDLARGKRMEELELNYNNFKVRLDKIAGNLKKLEKDSIINSLKEEEKTITKVKNELKDLKSKQSSLESQITNGLNDLNISFTRITKELEDLKQSAMSQVVLESKTKGIEECMGRVNKRLDSLEACVDELKARLANYEKLLSNPTEPLEKLYKHEEEITTLADLKNLILMLNKKSEENVEGICTKMEGLCTKMEAKIEGICTKVEAKIDTLSSDIKKNGRGLASLQFNLLSYELKIKMQEKRDYKHYEWNKRRFEGVFENLEGPFGRSQSR